MIVEVLWCPAQSLDYYQIDAKAPSSRLDAIQEGPSSALRTL